MSIRASDAERANLAEKHKEDQLSDQRADERFAPIKPYSRLILPDGKVMVCFVVDMLADVVPEIGTVLAVGRLFVVPCATFPGGLYAVCSTAKPRQR
jgi:hypothetical protein